MLSLKKELKANLDGATRVAVLGIGSSVRADDAVGVVLIETLRKSLRKARSRIPLKLFSCGVTPESYTGEIKRFKPSHILIVDALDMGKETGAIRIMDAAKDSAHVSFSTHGLPLKILIDYLIQSLGCRIVCIGIQPGSIGFGLSVSRKANKAVQRLSDLIMKSVI